MRIFTADRDGVFSFPPDVVGREYFFVGRTRSTIVVVDASDVGMSPVEYANYELKKAEKSLDRIRKELEKPKPVFGEHHQPVRIFWQRRSDV